MKYRVNTYITGVANQIFAPGKIVTDEDLIFDRASSNRPQLMVESGYISRIVEQSKKN